MRRRIDYRIWLPAGVAVACFATRALPKAMATDRPESHSISLPQLYGMPLRARLQRFELRADKSSVRFHVVGRHQEVLATCGRLSGELLLGPNPDDGSLTLSSQIMPNSRKTRLRFARVT